ELSEPALRLLVALRCAFGLLGRRPGDRVRELLLDRGQRGLGGLDLLGQPARPAGGALGHRGRALSLAALARPLPRRGSSRGGFLLFFAPALALGPATRMAAQLPRL